MLKFFCRITGDDYNLLAQDTPESRKKVAALASIIFVPVIIWFAIGFLLATQTLGKSIIQGLAVASILSFLIFLLERNIVMANGNKSIYRFRIFLGTVIALLGAVFLDEIIFHQDIEHQLVKMQDEMLLYDIGEIEEGYAPQIALAKQDVEQKYIAWQKLLAEANREADGSGGSGIKGVHAITRMKMDAANINKADYESARGYYETLRLQVENLKEERRLNNNQAANHGLLIRIKALFSLVFSDLFMGIIYIMFSAFLFAMEFLVVLMKNGWKQTNYERRIELIEEIGRKRMEKILKNDLTHYEPHTAHSGYQRVNDILSRNSNVSMFS
jgi:hypothetical protein